MVVVVSVVVGVSVVVVVLVEVVGGSVAAKMMISNVSMRVCTPIG